MKIPEKTLDDYQYKLKLADRLDIDLDQYENCTLGYVWKNIL
jgi:hypothetical protein